MTHPLRNPRMQTTVLWIALAAIPLLIGLIVFQSRRIPVKKIETVTVCGSLPPVTALLTDLCRNTTITVIAATPPDITMAELNDYYVTHQSLLDSLARSTALFDLRSAVPEDNLYGYLRPRNIHLIETDCATPLDPTVTPVPVRRLYGRRLPFFWLSYTNAMKMAEIAAKDLARLSPENEPQIAANLAAFKQRAINAKSTIQAGMGVLVDTRVLPLTRDFDYLITDLDLELAGADQPAETFESDTLTDSIVIATSPATIVSRWQPVNSVAHIIDSLELPCAVLINGDPALKNYSSGLIGLINRNADTLFSTMAKLRR